MSARFHPYLCGRNAAEWLIKMKNVKRFLTLVLVLVLMVSILAMTASAKAVGAPYLNDFSQFPGVWQSSQYSVATVAVQKFLMLAGDSLAKKIMPAGGADGYCGSKTVEAIKIFQEREKIHKSGDSGYGRVDQATWKRMAGLLEVDEELVGDYELAYFHRANSSYYTELDVAYNKNVILCTGSYYAMNHKMEWTSTPFYTP